MIFHRRSGRPALETIVTKSKQRLPASSVRRFCAFIVAVVLTIPAQAHRSLTVRPAAPIFPVLSSLLRRSGTFGDFDGDHQPDFAIADAQPLRGGTFRYRIGIHLSVRPDSTFEVEARTASGLHVTAQDVDGDHDLDLVITTRFGQQPIGVWINNGDGVFTRGDLGAYPNSIWHQGDRFFEPLERRVGQVVPFAPSSGWAIEPDVFAGRAILAMLYFRRTSEARRLSLPHLFRPVRAPPAQ